MFHVMRWIFSLAIVVVPAIVAGVPIALSNRFVPRCLSIGVAPLIYGFAYLLVCVILSFPFHRDIHAGVWPRSLSNAKYFRRRLYGLCWTFVYYSQAIYNFSLSSSWLKTVLFRGFGYKGSMGFIVYPDSWIRDLPLLFLGDAAYISNKATLATNIALQKNKILVDEIHLGNEAMVGHLSIVGPGSRIGDKSELGAFSVTGLTVKLDENVHTGGSCSIAHFVKIGPNVSIGHCCFIGASAKIASGLRIPDGTLIPSRAKIETQAEIDALVDSDAAALNALRLKLAAQLSVE